MPIHLQVSNSLDYEGLLPVPLDLLSVPDCPQVDIVRLITGVEWDDWSCQTVEPRMMHSDQDSSATRGPDLSLQERLAAVRRSWIRWATGNR